jgi:hypothetical protein
MHSIVSKIKAIKNSLQIDKILFVCFFSLLLVDPDLKKISKLETLTM